MAFGSRSDLLPQCLQGSTELSAKVRDGEGFAGLTTEYGDAVQGTSRSPGSVAKEQEGG